ncbi:hypothetical protein AC578_7423 [Pseudocercospora eumusae]|uniref:Uncharacterized protein n=1 Tax=Pseudocercospora eumusae TaxID=321146 RepID=A0A139H306_9PEZI|nr:hypothetical protein AC578_7423 [Pseudocercospora eumusae]
MGKASDMDITYGSQSSKLQWLGKVVKQSLIPIVAPMLPHRDFRCGNDAYTSIKFAAQHEGSTGPQQPAARYFNIAGSYSEA